MRVLSPVCLALSSILSVIKKRGICKFRNRILFYFVSYCEDKRALRLHSYNITGAIFIANYNKSWTGCVRQETSLSLNRLMLHIRAPPP
ncbi:hypothetical protein BX666DRAFT_1897556 [Dichotomocladium elegans]|nr:hypothetical protein BX666DRAFT_1897556 [Dichotomocladium elegans]